MLSLLREPETTHVAIAFDQVIESFRNELYSGYKTGEGIEPTLWAQFPIAERLSDALGLVVWPMVEFEADDALATAAARWADAQGVEQVRLCSPDKDLGQCVAKIGSCCSIVVATRSTTLPASRRSSACSQSRSPTCSRWSATRPTASPGIPRWGMKSAAAVLSVYHHIDAIPDDPNAWSVKVRGAKVLAENLAGAREQARLYRTLATLRVDVPLRRPTSTSYAGAAPSVRHSSRSARSWVTPPRSRACPLGCNLLTARCHSKSSPATMRRSRACWSRPNRAAIHRVVAPCDEAIRGRAGRRARPLRDRAAARRRRHG